MTPKEIAEEIVEEKRGPWIDSDTLYALRNIIARAIEAERRESEKRGEEKAVKVFDGLLADKERSFNGSLAEYKKENKALERQIRAFRHKSFIKDGTKIVASASRLRYDHGSPAQLLERIAELEKEVEEAEKRGEEKGAGDLSFLAKSNEKHLVKFEALQSELVEAFKQYQAHHNELRSRISELERQLAERVVTGDLWLASYAAAAHVRTHAGQDHNREQCFEAGVKWAKEQLRVIDTSEIEKVRACVDFLIIELEACYENLADDDEGDEKQNIANARERLVLIDGWLEKE